MKDYLDNLNREWDRVKNENIELELAGCTSSKDFFTSI